jgi:hypothetical protein
MTNDEKTIVEFFEKQYPKLEKAARAIWGDHEPTGQFVGTITCPKDGVLVTEKFITKEEWTFATEQAHFCKVCGSPLEVKLGDEIVYEYRWREKLVEIILTEGDKMKEKLDELKGIKKVEGSVEVVPGPLGEILGESSKKE